MKNTLLFTTLIAGLALTGCNKSTRTSTASSDPALAPATPASADTTASTAPATTGITSTTGANAPATMVNTTPTTTDTLGAKVDRTGDRVADASRNAADNVRDAARNTGAAMRETGRDLNARMTEWRLSSSDIEADVAANRHIVRTRTSAGAPTGNIDSDTIQKAIKGRFQADAKLADLKFDVNANKKGEVELEGKARTTDQIAHAIATALDTDGVSKVTSKIKIDADAGPNRK